MQRCGGSHGNTMRPCPCNGRFHTQPNSFSMFLSVPLDQINAEPSSTAVDCTLSLGTPSTRVSRDADKRVTNHAHVTNFCWDFLHAPTNFSQSGYKIERESFNGGDGVDPLLARRCANCDTTSTPLWRNGPRGPKSLCNACGIRFKKEERRAAGAEAAATDSQRAWVPLSESQKDSGAGVPFLSWRLNVTDRPSLVHEFTR